MISTATVGLRTKAMPQWLGWLGYALAAVLLLSITYREWMFMLFPLWVLMLSVYILVQNYRTSCLNGEGGNMSQMLWERAI